VVAGKAWRAIFLAACGGQLGGKPRQFGRNGPS